MSSAPEVRFLDPSTPPHILTLTLMTGLAALSMNVFLPSLPGMARDFGVDYAVMQLSVSAYIGASAVLQLLAGGATNAEIADTLSISSNTVKSHLKVIFDAFRVTKRTSCVRAARAVGVI